AREDMPAAFGRLEARASGELQRRGIQTSRVLNGASALVQAYAGLQNDSDRSRTAAVAGMRGQRQRSWATESSSSMAPIGPTAKASDWRTSSCAGCVAVATMPS